jgi:RNA polymerase sigma-70 factor, ECF subfamily
MPARASDQRVDADREAERRRVAAAQQDPGLFAPLYEAHFDVVYTYVARRVAERAEAEDLTSEVFRKALDGLGAFEWRGSPFAAWLLRIAANTLADRARRALRAVPGSQATDEAAPAVEPDVAQRALLFRLVAELPDDQRTVIELRFAEGRPVREIAIQLGRSEGAVKQLQLRALQFLRKRMRADDA